MPVLPVLYSFRRCPYAMRARMALIVAGETVELREVLLGDKPADMLHASPKATVPVMVLPDGQVIDESADIMRWALGRSDPAEWLRGDDHALIERIDGPFKDHLDRYKYPDRYPGNPLLHRAAGLAVLADLDARLATTGWLCGQGQSMADAAVMPFVRQFAAVDQAWFDAQHIPAIQDWLTRQINSDLFRLTMQQQAPWRAGDPPVLLGHRRA